MEAAYCTQHLLLMFPTDWNCVVPFCRQKTTPRFKSLLLLYGRGCSLQYIFSQEALNILGNPILYWKLPSGLIRRM